MVLASVTHHSFQVGTVHDVLRSQRPVASIREEVEQAQHVGLRAQEPPLPGTRLGTLPEPEAQGRAATVGYVAAPGAPLLAWPSLAAGDAIDDTSVYFLLEMALKTPGEVERMRRVERRRLAKEKEEKEQEEKHEKERKKAEVEETIARLTAEFWRERSQASSSSQRKRKKRKKKMLPRGGSSCGRVRRRQRQWHVPGWFPGFGASHAVFSSIVGRPDLPDLLVGMDGAPRVMFPSVVARPRMLCIMAGTDQKDSSLRASAWITSSSSACCCSCKPRTLRPVYVHAQAHVLHAVRPQRFFLDDCDELFPVWLFLAVSEIQRTLPMNISSEMLWRAHPGDFGQESWIQRFLSLNTLELL